MPRSPSALTVADVDELAAIIRSHAKPIPAPARQRFYEAVDDALDGVGELGPGIVARVCARVQRQFVAVPDAPPVVDGRR
jgi:hypothetical protein